MIAPEGTSTEPRTGPGLGAGPQPPPRGASREAGDAYLRAAFRHHSRTFSFAARLLPREVRLPVATVYLYCRTVDSTADERAYIVGREAARDEIAEMRVRLTDALAGRPAEALLWRRLAEVHEAFPLDPLPFHQQLDGALWDLDGREILTTQDLLDYSDLVAGSVGALMLPFLAKTPADRPRLDAPARALGVAMQITNILRDVGEDIRELGRVYLPADALTEAGLADDDLARAASGPGLVGDAAARYRDLIESLMTRAEALYDRAEAGIAELSPVRARWGIRTAQRSYRDILNAVRASGYDNLTQRAFVPTSRKARLALLPGYARRRLRVAR
ncbi:MAG: phytoene/squalene synthase family protein [Bacteroidota bacterium]